jgi:hypothetical protein
MSPRTYHYGLRNTKIPASVKALRGEDMDALGSQAPDMDVRGHQTDSQQGSPAPHRPPRRQVVGEDMGVLGHQSTPSGRLPQQTLPNGILLNVVELLVEECLCARLFRVEVRGIWESSR